MPKEMFGRDYAFRARAELLAFEEIRRLARAFASDGSESRVVARGVANRDPRRLTVLRSRPRKAVPGWCGSAQAEEDAMRSVRVVVVVATVAAAAAALAASAPASKRLVTGCSAGMDVHIASTSTYRLAVHVGMPEMMYTPAQVRELHPKSGEVMLRGRMMMAMKMAGSTRHLEVRICLRKNRAVITNAHPTITLMGQKADAMPMNVPVAVMEGIGAGTADLHYGNNVPMPGGHRFTVTVTLKGQKAVFNVSSPKAMA